MWELLRAKLVKFPSSFEKIHGERDDECEWFSLKPVLNFLSSSNQSFHYIHTKFKFKIPLFVSVYFLEDLTKAWVIKNKQFSIYMF